MFGNNRLIQFGDFKGMSGKEIQFDFLLPVGLYGPTSYVRTDRP